MPNKRLIFSLPNKLSRKSVSLFLIFSFLSQQLFGPPRAHAYLEEPQQKFPLTPSEILNRLSLPAEYGSLEEIYSGEKDRLVILVQDAHAIADAQKNIQKIISHFQSQYGVNLIGLEGTSGRLDTTLFRAFPDSKILQDVFQRYLERGELSGGAAAAVLNEGGSDYYGIEDPRIYEECVNAFLESLAHEPRLSKKLDGLGRKLSELKGKYYSPVLLELDRKLEDLEKGKIDLIQFLGDIPPHSPLSRFPQIAALLEEVQKEPSLSSDKLHREIQTLVGEIKTKIQNPIELKEFQGKLQEYLTEQISAEAFGAFLVKLAQNHGLSAPFSLESEIQIAQQTALLEMKSAEFSRQFQQLIREVKEGLFQNPNERELDLSVRRLRLLYKLNQKTLTYEEWGELLSEAQEARASEFFEVSKRIGDFLINFRTEFQPSARFYETTEKRDRAFLKQLTGLMNQKKRKVSLLVAGGFHTHGLTSLLKQGGISYVLISPAIQNLPGKIPYLDYMQGRVSWRSYFETRNGRIDLFEAFSKAVTDRLFSAEDSGLRTEREGPKSSYLSPHRSVLLKSWRDQIIRALASKGNIEKANTYTRFIDRLSVVRGSEGVYPDQQQKEWLEKVDRFIEGLHDLKDRNQLTPENIIQLTQPRSELFHSQAAAPTVTLGGLVQGFSVPAPWFSEFPEARSEMRIQQSPVARQTALAPEEAIEMAKEEKFKYRIVRLSRRFFSAVKFFYPYLAVTVTYVFLFPLVAVLLATGRIRVEGLENIPKREDYLAVANHISFIDAILMDLIFAVRSFSFPRFVAKRKHVGFISRGLIDFGWAIPIDFESELERKDKKEKVIDLLIKNWGKKKNGGIFPTGKVRRHVEDTFLGWKDTGAEAAKRAEKLVLPIAISGWTVPFSEIHDWTKYKAKNWDQLNRWQKARRLFKVVLKRAQILFSVLFKVQFEFQVAQPIPTPSKTAAEILDETKTAIATKLVGREINGRPFQWDYLKAQISRSEVRTDAHKVKTFELKALDGVEAFVEETADGKRYFVLKNNHADEERAGEVIITLNDMPEIGRVFESLADSLKSIAIDIPAFANFQMSDFNGTEWNFNFKSKQAGQENFHSYNKANQTVVFYFKLGPGKIQKWRLDSVGKIQVGIRKEGRSIFLLNFSGSSPEVSMEKPADSPSQAASRSEVRADQEDLPQQAADILIFDPRSEVRRVATAVLDALAEGKFPFKLAEQISGIAQFQFGGLAQAIKTEARNPRYLTRADDLRMIRASQEELMFRLDHKDYGRQLSAAVKDQIQRIPRLTEDYLKVHPKGKVNFAFAYPVVKSDPRVQRWLLEYIKMIQKVQREIKERYPKAKVEGNIRILMSSAEKKSLTRFVRVVEASGVVKIILTDYPTAAGELQTYLIQNQNALVYGFPESGLPAEGLDWARSELRFVNAAVDLGTVLPFAIKISNRLATESKITAEALREIPKTLAGVAVFDGTSLFITSKALDYIYQQYRSEARLAQMA